jgi:hypothetical protein
MPRPERAVAQPRWTSATFLLYTGGVIVLAAAVQSLGLLAQDYGNPAFAGWSALIFAGLAVLALAFRRIGSWIAAGVFAVSAVVAWGVLVAALETWFGWLPHDYVQFRGFHVGVLLLVLLVLLAALVALRALRFPLLVALVAVASWFFVTDLISGGGNWSAVVTLLLGGAFLAAALIVDGGPSRPYGFWLHAAAGVAVAGALLWFWHDGDADWALVAVAGLAYVAVAALTRRSSYAVLGAYGLYLAAVHFASEWSGQGIEAFGYLPFLLFFPFLEGAFYEAGKGGRGWAAPLTFAFLGFLLVVLGLLLERRRADAVPAVA